MSVNGRLARLERATHGPADLPGALLIVPSDVLNDPERLAEAKAATGLNPRVWVILPEKEGDHAQR